MLFRRCRLLMRGGRAGSSGRVVERLRGTWRLRGPGSGLSGRALAHTGLRGARWLRSIGRARCLLHRLRSGNLRSSGRLGTRGGWRRRSAGPHPRPRGMRRRRGRRLSSRLRLGPPRPRGNLWRCVTARMRLRTWPVTALMGRRRITRLWLGMLVLRRQVAAVVGWVRLWVLLLARGLVGLLLGRMRVALRRVSLLWKALVRLCEVLGRIALMLWEALLRGRGIPVLGVGLRWLLRVVAVVLRR